MTDDIVARLRQTHRVGCDCVGCEAAEEIERLREHLTSVKFMRCRDVGSLEDRLSELSGDAGRLRLERDEARRSCCEYAAIVDGADTADGMESGRFYEIAMKYMKDRGWDCFKEATDGK